MTVRKRALKSFKHLSIPVSYRVLDDKFLSDARNIFDNKGVTETRYGLKRYNDTSLGGTPLSISYFKTSAGIRYKIVKVGSSLYSVAANGASTVIKSGLSATTKHRGDTLNDRHIIAIEGDGLFSFNGTIFTQLGQLPPTGATIATSSGGSLTDNTNYKVGLTFYASSIGFETNVFESNSVLTAAPNKQIVISSIPTTANNALVDTVKVYLKNTDTNTPYLFIADLALGSTTYTITNPPSSTLIPPTKNAPPIQGGGKFLSVFGTKVAYAGNSIFPNEVFISEEYIPDAYDSTTSHRVLFIPGQGPITGIAVGLYNDKFLNPFLVAFKKTSITIYSELNDIPVQTTIDAHVGCVSNETIRVRNGVVYFMSENGWYAIANGSLIKDENKSPASLGGGAIDDIFSRVGWSNELNAPQFSSFFSAYYSTNNLYMTFVCEGANSSITKAYVYEEKIGGFRPWEFKFGLTCACEGEDDLGYQCIFIADSTGSIFTYSNRSPRHDEDNTGASLSIPAFALLPYIQPGEDSNSYNFRTLTVRALASANPIMIRTFPSFSLLSFDSFQYDFPNTSLGFTLDVSQLDVDILGDERVPVTAMADINRVGETILIGFYQDVIDGNIAIISSQLTLNKNGNRNL